MEKLQSEKKKKKKKKKKKNNKKKTKKKKKNKYWPSDFLLHITLIYSTHSQGVNKI